MVTSRGKIDGDEDVLGDGIAFAGVSKYPAQSEMRAARLDGVQGRGRPEPDQSTRPRAPAQRREHAS